MRRGRKAAGLLGEPYQPNPGLAGLPILQIAKPAETVAFYEMRPTADGTRGVAFVDGHVQRIREAEWPRLREASRIP